ncbi:FecR family protein [Pedobacter sp. GR22-6]|uniref:FecR family protein n=1 Tax=Pedobacter sp. GR22-6 TaxID=3127957 RepID=UPI00307D6940
MTNEELNELIAKYKSGKCSDDERAFLEDSIFSYNEHIPPLNEQEVEAMCAKIFEKLPSKPNGKLKLWSVIIATAATLALSAGVYLIAKHELLSPRREIITKTDIAPGSNRAILKLANGKMIQLAGNKSGIKQTKSTLIYGDGTPVGVQNGDSEINALITPKGGQYTLTLSDGSVITLNAGSELKYPAQFPDVGERKVYLSGEAFFEITKDKNHPFIVESRDQRIKVLGTKFNVNSYASHAAATTLAEGSVQLTKLASPTEKRADADNLILKPGEQAIVGKDKITVSQVDVDLNLAWIYGKTEFENAELKTVMQMLERWYDVEVVYKSYPQASRFSGSISRNKNLSEVLRLLETTGEVHFKIDERRVIVMK